MLGRCGRQGLGAKQGDMDLSPRRKPRREGSSRSGRIDDCGAVAGGTGRSHRLHALAMQRGA